MTELATGKRTYVISMILIQLKATNPQYIVNWGDDSEILSAKPLSAKTATIAKHLYEKSGIYTIKVTGFNNVSSITLNKTVSI